MVSRRLLIHRIQTGPGSTQPKGVVDRFQFPETNPPQNNQRNWTLTSDRSTLNKDWEQHTGGLGCSKQPRYQEMGLFTRKTGVLCIGCSGGGGARKI